MAVTVKKVELFDNYEFMGLSTDEKPTDHVGVNSLFLELDKGDFYYLKQQGSSTTTTTTIECDPLTGWNPSRDYSNAYETIIYKDGINLYENLPQNITVTWDGTSYELVGTYDENTHSYLYGELPNDDYEFTWSNYPFCIKSGQSNNDVYCEDNDEHTVSFSWSETVTVEPIWEKVGSKSSPTPSSDALLNLTTSADDWNYEYGAYSYAKNDGYIYVEYPNLPNEITVEWDGETYTCTRSDNDEYGAQWVDEGYDFTEYPFNIFSETDRYCLMLISETEGAHTVKITGDGTLIYEAIYDDNVTADQHITQVSPPQDYWTNSQYIVLDADVYSHFMQVTFDGVKYELEANIHEGSLEFGAYTYEDGVDFAEYPFGLYIAGDQMLVYFEDNNQHALKIEQKVWES